MTMNELTIKIDNILKMAEENSPRQYYMKPEERSREEENGTDFFL